MTGPVPDLVLDSERARRLLRPFEPWFSPNGLRNPSDRTGSIPQLKDEVAEWCTENLRSAVLVFYGVGDLKWHISFGREIDHVLFKLRWY